MILILFLLILTTLIIYFNIYVDIFRDYRDKLHIIIWYTYKDRRKYIDLIGSQ